MESKLQNTLMIIEVAFLHMAVIGIMTLRPKEFIHSSKNLNLVKAIFGEPAVAKLVTFVCDHWSEMCEAREASNTPGQKKTLGQCSGLQKAAASLSWRPS